jgi:hypothetical protein
MKNANWLLSWSKRPLDSVVRSFRAMRLWAAPSIADMASSGPEKRRNRLGIFEASEEHRELVKYNVPFRVPDGVDGADIFGVGDVEEEPPIKAFGPGFLPVGTVATHTKGTVYLALDMRQQASVKKVILKEAKPGCMSDNQGRDAIDRLHHQAQVHAAVQGEVRVPKVESFFRDGDRAYLALELIEDST